MTNTRHFHSARHLTPSLAAAADALSPPRLGCHPGLSLRPQQFSYARGAPLSSVRWGPTPSSPGSRLSLARVQALSACGRSRARTRETSAGGGGAPTALEEDSLSPPQRGCRVGGPGSSRGPQALLPALVLARTAGASQNSNPGFSHQRSFSVVKLSNAKIIATITKREITLGSLQPMSSK